MTVELWAYGDESGISRKDKFCLLAGYIGAPDAWEPFTEKWAAVLRRENIAEFHAIEFFHPNSHEQNPYANWTSEKRRGFLTELIALINIHDILPVGRAVDVAAFYKLTAEEKRYFTGSYLQEKFQASRRNTSDEFSTSIRRVFTAGGVKNVPYGVAFQLFMSDAFDAADDDSAIHVILDEQNVMQKGAERVFNDRWQNGSHASGKRFSTLTYAVSHDHEQLQASDLYAYAWYRHLSGRLNGEIAYALTLLTHKKSSMQFASDTYFQYLLADLRSDHFVEDMISGNKSRSLELRYSNQNERSG